jgi:hypothetical protein
METLWRIVQTIGISAATLALLAQGIVGYGRLTERVDRLDRQLTEIIHRLDRIERLQMERR